MQVGTISNLAWPKIEILGSIASSIMMFTMGGWVQKRIEIKINVWWIFSSKLSCWIHSAHSLHELIALIVCMPPTNEIASYGAILYLATPPNACIFDPPGYSYGPTCRLEPLFIIHRLVNVFYAWESYLCKGECLYM